jgi:hypothetical protein
MSLNNYRKEEGFTLPLFIVARIVGRHPNYLTALWKTDPERVKKYIREAEDQFTDICV